MTQGLAVEPRVKALEVPRSRRWALTASLVLSISALAFNVPAWIWADNQQIDYDDMSLVNIENSIRTEACCTDADYLGYYLVGMLVIGMVALVLAFVGARAARDRPWVATAAGAFAMFALAVPVLFLIGHEINHWYVGVNPADFSSD